MEPKDTLWPLDPHTLGKHLVLKAYLDAWFPIMGRWNGRILFIDGFAGPGEYKNGERGSPLIALKSLMDHARGIL
jgi:three-Cys-motif partner protein